MRARTYETNSPRVVLALAAAALSCATFAVFVLAPSIVVDRETMHEVASDATRAPGADANSRTPTAEANPRRDGDLPKERS